MYVFRSIENSEIFWLPVRELVSVEQRFSVEDTPLRYGSLRNGREDKHPEMLLVLVRRSLVLFELSIYYPRIRFPHALFCFAFPDSGVL